MSPKTRVLIGAALVALALVYLAFAVDLRAGSKGPQEPGVNQVQARAGAPAARSSVPTLAAVPDASATREASETRAAGEPEQAAAPAQAGVGELRLAVLDAETRLHLGGISVRGISEERFIDLDATSPISLRLSAGEYELLLLKQRYDSVQLAPFFVAENQTVDLGHALMWPGSGAIEGVVHVPAAIVENGLTVELHGGGRNPCSLCEGISEPAEPCGACGFGREKSVLAVDPGASFAFASLAAGDYYFVVYDGETVLLTRKLSLAPGERRWLDAELNFLDLDLQLTGPDGLPFTGHWYEEGELFTGPILFFLLNDGTCCGASQWIPIPAGQTSAVPYEGPAPRTRAPGREATKWEPTPGQPTPPAPPRQADVAKRAHNQLWPTLLTPPPAVRTRPAQTTFRAPDLFRIQRVPVSSTSVLVACGPYFTSTRLSLPDWDGHPIEVKLSARCTVPSKGLQGMAACTSCHALPSGVFQ